MKLLDTGIYHWKGRVLCYDILEVIRYRYFTFSVLLRSKF